MIDTYFACCRITFVWLVFCVNEPKRQRPIYALSPGTLLFYLPAYRIHICHVRVNTLAKFSTSDRFYHAHWLCVPMCVCVCVLFTSFYRVFFCSLSSFFFVFFLCPFVFIVCFPPDFVC